MFELNGKTGIVTGGSSGLGFAIANVLAEAGAKVYAFSRTGAPKDKTAKCHPNITHVKIDICDYAAAEKLIHEIGEKDGIDFLVNNAGATEKKRAEEFSDASFEHIMQVNVNCVFKLSCLCYPYLKKANNKGRIVNITSMSAHLGFTEVVPYCTSKGAVLSMTRALAVEWAEDNINVNSIAPGWFPSVMLQEVMDEDRKARILNRMPVHAFGKPEYIGSMAAFLISDEAIYITGQDHAVDGGALAYGY